MPIILCPRTIKNSLVAAFVSALAICVQISTAMVATASPVAVTTSAFDTGSSSELVSSIPITSFSADETRVVYSLPLHSIQAGEVLRAAANLEVTNPRPYTVTDSVRILLGLNPTDTSGSPVTPWTSVGQTPDMYHWTLPLSGVYHATSNLGTRYLKVIVKARTTTTPQPGDTLTVQPNFGGLAVTRSTPAQGPMSQPTHQLEPLIDPLPVETSSIPVDSSWRRVLTRKISSLALDDILDITAQLQLGKPAGIAVRVESKVTYTAAPSADPSSTASPSTSDRLATDMSPTRLVHSSQLRITDPTKPYLNLLVRAVPVSGTPSPLTVTSGTATLNVILHKADPGDLTAPLREGTQMEERADLTPNVSSIPFSPASSPQPRVVASTSISWPWKGEVLRARGSITGDLAGGSAAQLLTTLVLADSPTATTGETVGVFSGDKIPTAGQIHTVVKEGTFVIPQTVYGTKYVNLVARPARAPAYAGEAMSVSAASISLTRSMPTAPLDEGFEDGLDALQRFEWDGPLIATSAHAREGSKSMLADLDFSNDYQGDPPGSRRIEARPELDAGGAYTGAESWYGFSAYFPDQFNVPGPNPYRLFDGLIDEVRLYNQPLSEARIKSDLAGSYGQLPAPIAAYGFNEGSGTTVTDSAGNNDGTVEGAAWTSNGKFGSALDFNGFNDLVTVPDAEELDFTNSFTLEAWVRPDSLDSLAPVITKAVGPASKAGYTLEAQSYGGPTGRVFNNGPTVIATGPAALSIGSWSHVALTSDGKNLRVYVNGNLVATQPAINAAPTSANLTIGASSELIKGQAGPYTVFTQWKPIDDAVTCGAGTAAAAPPIMYAVQYYKAEAHTNPGETETATPVDGAYLEMRFQGGEIAANDCEHFVDPPQYYVLAPLEHNRWYDFVQHTRWTYLKGGPNNSVTELWVNGEQVLGNQSVPVTTPSALWHGTVDVHNPFSYVKWGLYGGNSFDDPTQEIYIDAVRSGNSYGEVAPGQ
jgi:Concanavalin A-like lectin/glucanases superfamily